MPFEMERSRYHELYGPTIGDRFRLGDTNLIARVERDYTAYGDEVLGGWAKTLRAGMMATHQVPGDSELDYLIAGAVIMDPVLGIFKGNIGIKDGIIAGIGRAGNPDIMGGGDLVVGSNTVMFRGTGLIATPGGVDSHVHVVSPKVMVVGLSAGLTTFISAGLDTNGRFILERTFEAFEDLPVNLGLQGLGSATHRSSLERSVEAGACGFKVHEDTGAYPDVIDLCLRVAEEYDVSVALHTDGLQESVDVSETVDAIGGRSVHAYHVEGAGGGHAPDLLELAGVPNIIPSSTTPTIPYTVGTYQEHFAMTIETHRLKPSFESDMEALDVRLRRETMAAEDVLHDMGAISIINSDSQGMGRIGEVISRTWQLAHKMKAERGPTHPDHDNERILRYLAKYTINPAITHGISGYVGSLEPGKLADIVLWSPAFFGVKPEMVIKGGFMSWMPLGEGNATIRGSEPVIYGPMFGGTGVTPASLSALFVSRASLDKDLRSRLRTNRRLLPVENVRGVTKGNMMYNDAIPRIEVDTRTAQVRVDGTTVTSNPLSEVPLHRLYFLS